MRRTGWPVWLGGQTGHAVVWQLYSMTSSARARIVCGIARPSAFAVFRLITSSKSCRLDNRQLRGLGAFEYLAGIIADQPVIVGEIGAVTDESTTLDKRSPVVHRRQTMPRRQRDDAVALGIQKRIRSHQQRPGALLDDGSKCLVELFRPAGADDDQLAVECLCPFLRCLGDLFRIGVLGVEDHPDRGSLRR